MIGIEYEKSVVALVCWKQMRGEMYRGMVSLASMLKNRAEAGWFGGSIYNNALAFSREMEMQWADFPDARDPQFSMLLQAIDGVFTDVIQDKTQGAMYCAHLAVVDKIAGERTLQVGQFIFFKDVK